MIIDIDDFGTCGYGYYEAKDRDREGPLGSADLYAEIYQKCDQMILYHGTSSTFLEKILKEGLKPRELTGNSCYDKGESNPKLVYLGPSSTANALIGRSLQKYGGYMVIFKLLVDADKLVPDEDSKEEKWEYSLATYESASCAHKGIIPPERILGYHYFACPDEYWENAQIAENGLPYVGGRVKSGYTAVRADPKITSLEDFVRANPKAIETEKLKWSYWYRGKLRDSFYWENHELRRKLKVRIADIFRKRSDLELILST